MKHFAAAVIFIFAVLLAIAVGLLGHLIHFALSGLLMGIVWLLIFACAMWIIFGKMFNGRK